MSMPQWYEFMRPVLIALDEHGIRSVSDLEEFVVESFGLSDEDRAERLGKSGQRRLLNRLGWATTSLEKAKCLEYGTKKGTYVATKEGKAFLKAHPGPFTDKDLLRESSTYRAWKEQKKQKLPVEPAGGTAGDKGVTPQEAMEEAYQEMREALTKELLQRVYAQDPYEFEHTVARLLKAMGYGDTWGKSVGVTKKSGDDGVDGFVREDRLGFDMIYYQAKRWKPGKSVGSPEVNAFAGALLGKGASKGVFITTGTFTQKARDYVEGLKQQRVILIDGRQLAELMVDHDVGVSTVQTYEIKSVDSDFFGSG